MEDWKMEAVVGGKTFAEMKIQSGIFQRDLPMPSATNSNDVTELHT